MSTVSYGAEILPYHMRLKGLSIMLSVQSVAQAFVSHYLFYAIKPSDGFGQNQWVNPVALNNLAWK